jgi:competence transcription factor ComK
VIIDVLVRTWFELTLVSQSSKPSDQNYASKPKKIIDMDMDDSTLCFIQHNALELSIAYQSLKFQGICLTLLFNKVLWMSK